METFLEDVNKKMKNDFNKDLNDIEDFNLGLDSKSEKEKGLLVFEIFVFLMIIYNDFFTFER